MLMDAKSIIRILFCGCRIFRRSAQHSEEVKGKKQYKTVNKYAAKYICAVSGNHLQDLRCVLRRTVTEIVDQAAYYKQR